MVKSPYAGLPARGTRVCVHASGVKHDGIVHGYSLALGSTDRFVWIAERPGVLTRLRLAAVDEWANGV